MLDRAVFGHPGNPYWMLLRAAGLQRQDIGRLIEQEGLEAALEVLFKSGVYLTTEEFKGRQPVVRGGLSFFIRPNSLRTGAYAPYLTVQSSGSSGPRTPVPIDLAYAGSRSVNVRLLLEACRGIRWSHGVWAVPGSSALLNVLELGGCGMRPVRWFSQVDPGSGGLHPRYRWSARGVRWASLLSGLPLPELIHVPVSSPEPILDWLEETLGKGKTPHLFTYPSSAISLAQAAQKRNTSLTGVRLTLTGEPITRVRLATIRNAGALVMTRYGAAESGTVGYGCLSPEKPDEVHLLTDRLALIQNIKEFQSAGVPAGGLWVTSLDAAAPFFLLNVSLGDQAVLSRQTCGCPLEGLGWKTRLHSILSYAKITSEGMTFLKSDILGIVEEVLPRLFGGGPTSYQLLEEEDQRGRPLLRLLIHPDVGPVHKGRVLDALLSVPGPGNGVERVREQLWRDARLIKVERRPPIPTASGKILPFLPRSHLPNPVSTRASGKVLEQ